MPINAAVNDNAPLPESDQEIEGGIGESRIENVVGAALLVATAFRLRDEEALILTLRRLTDAVDALEAEAEAAEGEERRAACG
jgi:hypothetical protein